MKRLGALLDSCDVLIIGAGPTGLMMAAELARYGISCRIIDKETSLSQESRALAIQARTMEVFNFLGISEKFLEKGQKIQALNLFSQKHRLARVKLYSLNTSFPFVLCVPQKQTEEILIEHLSSLGIKVEREKELIDLEETENKIIATTQDGEQIETKWIIGCDGAHSFVRKYLKIDFKGEKFPSLFSLADVKMQWEYPHGEMFVFWHEEGVLAAIPFPEKDTYRLIFESNFSSPPSLEEIQAIVRKRIKQDAVLSDPIWITNFNVNSRLSNHYQVGNFFLAGDAAHIHSPVGGQGMNTGIQDAFNLAWKLSLVLQKKIHPKILTSYHKERHAVGEKLLRGTKLGTKVATLKNGWKTSLRNFLVSFFLKIPVIKHRLIRAVAQLSICYDKSSIIYETGRFKGGPRVGSRMIGFDEVLIKNQLRFVVIFFTSEEVPEIQVGSIPIKTVIVPNDPKFGITETGCYVVRPDGYIGYRQTPIDLKKLKSYFKNYC